MVFMLATRYSMLATALCSLWLKWFIGLLLLNLILIFHLNLFIGFSVEESTSITLTPFVHFKCRQIRLSLAAIFASR